MASDNLGGGGVRTGFGFSIRGGVARDGARRDVVLRGAVRFRDGAFAVLFGAAFAFGDFADGAFLAAFFFESLGLAVAAGRFVALVFAAGAFRDLAAAVFAGAFAAGAFRDLAAGDLVAFAAGVLFGFAAAAFFAVALVPAVAVRFADAAPDLADFDLEPDAALFPEVVDFFEVRADVRLEAVFLERDLLIEYL